MTEKELLKRGQEIFSELEETASDYEDQSRKRKYACSIVQAVNLQWDNQISKDDICIALAKAEILGKRVTIEPDAEFSGAGDGTMSDNNDGWSYHIVIS